MRRPYAVFLLVCCACTPASKMYIEEQGPDTYLVRINPRGVTEEQAIEVMKERCGGPVDFGPGKHIETTRTESAGTSEYFGTKYQNYRQVNVSEREYVFVCVRDKT